VGGAAENEMAFFYCPTALLLGAIELAGNPIVYDIIIPG